MSTNLVNYAEKQREKASLRAFRAEPLPRTAIGRGATDVGEYEGNKAWHEISTGFF